MVVIMEYDMADNGRDNPDRGTKKKNREKNNTHSTFAKGEPSGYHETNSRNICHISTSFQGITWIRNESGAGLLRVYYCGPYIMQSSM
jgi:hypothetical protein